MVACCRECLLLGEVPARHASRVKSTFWDLRYQLQSVIAGFGEQTMTCMHVRGRSHLLWAGQPRHLKHENSLGHAQLIDVPVRFPTTPACDHQKRRQQGPAVTGLTQSYKGEKQYCTTYSGFSLTPASTVTFP